MQNITRATPKQEKEFFKKHPYYAVFQPNIVDLMKELKKSPINNEIDGLLNQVTYMAKKKVKEIEAEIEMQLDEESSMIDLVGVIKSEMDDAKDFIHQVEDGS